MHREAYEFVKTVKAQMPEYFTNSDNTVLEVGSLNINGTVRDFFTPDCVYIGIDLGEGNGVDLVSHVCDFQATRNFEVVISSEALEHDDKWQASLQKMYELLKPNGILIITCAAPNRPEHGTHRTNNADASPHTADYYRNISIEDFAQVLPANLWSKSYLGYRGQMEDLYFVGIKKEGWVNPHKRELAKAAEDAEWNKAEIEKLKNELSSEAAKSLAGTSELISDGHGNWSAANVPFTLAELVEKHGPIRFPDTTEAELEKYHQMLDKNREEEKGWIAPPVERHKYTVTAEICTKDRSTTTLPACLSAIIHQTHKPQWIAIYNDGEPKSLETIEPFSSLLRMANDLGINWTMFDTPQWGQVASHQHALDHASTDTIWRVDDDEIPEPNCLENLLAEMKDGVGAVGGLVHHPSGVVPLPDFVDGSLNDVTRGLNISWYAWDGAPREVEHLYSTFLMRTESARKAGGYCKELSKIGHHEETLLSNSIFRTGAKLIVTPKAKTWHLRQPSGGIRTYSDGSLWERDEVIFQEYLRTVGHVSEDSKLLLADMGLGDHLLLRGLLVDEFKRKYPDRKWTLAVCYPEVFEGIDNVTIISIAEAKILLGAKYAEHSLFEYGWHHGNGRHILEVMREFFGRE